METKHDSAPGAEAAIGKAALEHISKQVAGEVKRLAPAAKTAAGWIDRYLFIDFGYAGQTFQPNSVQFYKGAEFLCSKLIDNTSIQSLVPILSCKYVHVVWDTSTMEALHIYGMQPKDTL